MNLFWPPFLWYAFSSMKKWVLKLVGKAFLAVSEDFFVP